MNKYNYKEEKARYFAAVKEYKQKIGETDLIKDLEKLMKCLTGKHEVIDTGLYSNYALMLEQQIEEA